MSHADFLRDRVATRDRGEWLIELYPKDPDGIEQTLRFSRRGTTTKIATIVVGDDTIPAHTPYRKRIIQAPTYTQSLWQPGRILSSSIPSYGTLKLTNKDGGLDQYTPKEGWQWSGCTYKAFFGDRYYLESTLGKVSEGVMGEPKFSISEVEIPLHGLESLFDVTLSDRVYRGTSYALELFGDRTVTYGSTPAALNITGDLTIEGWIWLDGLPSADRRFYGWADGIAATFPFRFSMTTLGKIRLDATVGGVIESKAHGVPLTHLRFYHFAWIISGSTPTFLLWDDENQLLTVETLSNFSGARQSVSAGAAFIHRSGSDATFKPWLDEWRVWNYARSIEDIKSNRFRPLAGSVPASCVHCVGFDNGTGTTVTDSSATAAHGTISGAGTSTWLWMHEGGPELAGAPKPDIWGERFGVPPVMVDPTRNGYQVAGDGQIHDLTTYAGGAAHTMDASAASFRAYITTVPAAGHSLRYLPRGLFKLGAQPSFPVSALVKGYSGGSLGYQDKGSGIIRDIVTRRGPELTDPTDLDTASFAVEISGVQGVFIPDPRSKKVREILDFVALSGGAWWGYQRASVKFHIENFAGPGAVPDKRFTPRNIVSIEPLPPVAVIYKIVVRYRQNNVALSEEQVDFTVKSSPDWQNWTREWLEESSSDDDLRDEYPGEASIVLTVDTGLQYAADAKSLADELLVLLKGKKEGWNLTVVSEGLEMTPGQTVTQEVYLQRDRDRLGLDGEDKFVVLNVTDNRQQGTVSMSVWGESSS